MNYLVVRLVTIFPILFVLGCNSVQDTKKIPYDPELPLEGAAKHERAFDVKDSPYYKPTDFYNKKSTGSLTLIENFRTIQQATEVTCGPACVLMVLEHYGKRKGYNEKQLQDLRGTEQDTTFLRHLINIFDEIGGFEYESTYDYQNPDRDTIPETFFLKYLKQKIPVIVGTNIWGGHWQIIIGYDTMGTPHTADDILILAEPYDTTDHNQDGYIIFPLHHFYESCWRNDFDPDYKWGLFLSVWPKQT